jgi:hypothetical protein
MGDRKMAEGKVSLNNEATKSLYTTEVFGVGRRYKFEVMEGFNGRRFLRVTEFVAAGLTQTCQQVTVLERELSAFVRACRRAADYCDPKPKAFNIEQIRATYPRAYKPWTPAEERELVLRFHRGIKVHELGKYFQRQPGAIRSRLWILGFDVNGTRSKPTHE